MSTNLRQVRDDACRVLFVCALLISMTIVSVHAQERWSLETSMQRVLDVAPEIHAAESAVAARQGAARQAAAWPNPEIELRADDRVSREIGNRGTDYSQFIFSQPVPLSGQRGHRREIAAAELAASQAGRRYQQLLLETETARRFHSLQLTTELLHLAEQRLRFADELQQVGERRRRAGELAHLEQLRIDLIRETAQQAAVKAEGKHGEALSLFRAYLGLSAEEMPELASLQPIGEIPPLTSWQTGLPEHPALVAETAKLQSARANIELARSQRLPDPVLRLFHERDAFINRRIDVYGFGVALTVPLWDRKSGHIDEAHAQANQVRADIQALERDLDSRLRQSYQHLNHLMEEAKHYRGRVLEPAQALFDLTRKAYAAGEAEILALIDANNTYFDAQARYFELLQEAWLEVAELRLAAGRTLITVEQEKRP